MDPNKMWTTKNSMTELELSSKREDYKEVIEVVRFFSEKIVKSLEGTPLLIAISDENGYLLDTLGDESIKSIMAKLGIEPGICFKNEDIGTNVVRLTLEQGEPVQLIGTNHFHTFLYNNACYGVPFNDKEMNNILGSVCIMTSIELQNPFFLMSLTIVVDAIERELLLRKQNRKLNIMNQIMLSKTKNAIIITDAQGLVVDHNEAAEKISGFRTDEIIGKSILKSPRTSNLFEEVLNNKKQYENTEVKFKNDNGEEFVYLVDAQVIRDKNLNMIGTFGQFRDITERYLAEEKYNYLAHHDELTGLPNRRYFQEILSKCIDNRTSESQDMVLIFLDLDKLKMINDTFGHTKGDLLIKEAANILKECIGENDHVFRVGGDEFILLCFNIKNRKQATELADKIINAFNREIIMDHHQLHITPSFGLVLYQENPSNFENCLIYADNAMYKAKSNGRNGYVIYDSILEETYKDKLTLKMDIEKALENNEFRLHYQPQINIKNGEIVGVEALIRWEHKEKGIIFPDEFIPIAEETGIICKMGEWVLREACCQVKKWENNNLSPIKVGVNLSAQQFLKGDLAKVIKDVLAETGINPRHLELEITESMTMEVDYAMKTLNELKGLGIKISIDDFGTGYSSLNYLKKFSIDYLKIDRSFIKDIMNNETDANIVDTIISMAHNLKLEVIAEGVEDRDQLSFLQSHNCDFVQGYFFSKPLSANVFEDNFYNFKKEL
jgi:diguanylate cyclase (GGDEF)-like protein/PAS domain S-box-containing protein